MSLRFRLNLMIALTLLLIVGAGAVFVVDNARRAVVAEVDSSVNMVLRLIEADRGQAETGDNALIDRLQQVAGLGKTRHLHIQFQQQPDKVIHLPPPADPGPAAAPRWFVWAVTPPPRVAETRVRKRDGGEIRITVEANPIDEIEEAWEEARGFLILMVVLGTTVALLVHFTLGRAFRSVNVILRGLEDIEHGDYRRRLMPFALPEFDRISGAINHMAATLEQAREENRRLSQQSLAIQEEERRHVARELHDELGQSISAIKLMAASLRHGRDDSQRGETVDAILGICDGLFGVVRGMMRRLRPLILDELGLIASLEDMMETWRACNPGIHLQFVCEPAVETLVGEASIHVFRIVQECLTNVVKHAEARAVEVSLWVAAGPPALMLDTVEIKNPLPLGEGLDSTPLTLMLRVADDGAGFLAGQAGGGFGLHGMRERIASLGGEFRLDTAPGRGTRIEIGLPCPESTP